MKISAGIPWLKIIVITVLLLGGYWGFLKWRRPAVASSGYRTALVETGDIVQSVTANGSLNPVRNVQVGSQISGIITEIMADFNSKVREGQVVAQIDPATYERALFQSEAELANAEAALELAELNFQRARELFDDNLVSKSAFDQERVNLSQAKAMVKTRQANVDRAKVDLSRTTIYAPMDGVVISRRVEQGQTVAASMNTPTLFIIANDLAKMQIEAAVSEADVGGVLEGQRVLFDVDAFMGRQFEGLVSQVRYEPNTNQNVVTYTTVVSVDNEDLKLRPGMTANAKIITDEKRGVVKIPNAAMRFRPPEGAEVIEEINLETESEPAPVPLIESGPFAGLPIMPWTQGGERRRPSDQERDAYVATLTSEQKAKYQQAMAQMRARFAQGGGPGGGGGDFGGGGASPGARKRSQTEGPSSAKVYVIQKNGKVDPEGRPALKAVTVQLGITDGTSTEVLAGLDPGDEVATGISVASTNETATRNPFNPFGNRPRGR